MGGIVTMRDKSRILKAAMILGMAICICGCGASEDAGTVKDPDTGVQTPDVESQGGNLEAEEDGTNASEADSTENSVTGYAFDVNGITVQVDMDMDELAVQLGESKSIFEAPSCAGEGISYIYNFTSYEIETYPAADGKNRIGFIILKDDTVATKEGIDLSMTKEDVILAYGEDYEENGSQISYEKDGTKLNFIFEEDIIISIEYVSAVIG